MVVVVAAVLRNKSKEASGHKAHRSAKSGPLPAERPHQWRYHHHGPWPAQLADDGEN